VVAGGRRRCERHDMKICRRGLVVDAAAVPAQQQLQQLVAPKVRHKTHSAPTQKMNKTGRHSREKKKRHPTSAKQGRSSSRLTCRSMS
jgi:hypothetical protein